MNSFFVLGCWNSDHCEGLDYRTAVLKDLQTKHKNKPFQFGVIAGDNIYQQQKNYYLKTLKYGFYQLSQLQLPLYTILGNHDVHKPSILEAHLTLHKQRKIILPKNCYVVRFEHLRLIMLDTNLLTMKTDKGGVYDKLLHDYSDFFETASSNDLLEQLQAELQSLFDGWTLVIGHEPLISIKSKKGQVQMSMLTKTSELLKLLSNVPKCIYLCADVHAFEVINIPINNSFIPMVVAGTGGADPDILPPSNAKLSYMNQTLTIEGMNPAYGYVSVHFTKNIFEIHFHPLKGCSDGQSKLVFRYQDRQLKQVSSTPIPKPIKCSAEKPQEILCQHNEPVMVGGFRRWRIKHQLSNSKSQETNSTIG